MSKITPRGSVPSLIGAQNGRPRRITVGRASNCYRCNDDFVKGQMCIEIPQLGTSHSKSRRVCDECFQAILTKTEQDLEEVRAL